MYALIFYDFQFDLYLIYMIRYYIIISITSMDYFHFSKDALDRVCSNRGSSDQTQQNSHRPLVYDMANNASHGVMTNLYRRVLTKWVAV